MNIRENDKSLLNDFIQLNEAWIAHHFTIEDSDRQLAKKPDAIINQGGFIFNLVVKNITVGACALFNDGNGIYEISRMAVASGHKGKGYGDALIEKCLSKVKQLNAKKVYLFSNTKLKPAIGLYRKHGFQTKQEGNHPRYSRSNIMMELIL